MSGLSDPSSCALSPIQKRFLDSLAVPADWKVYRNFPYLPGSDGPGTDPALWRASLANLKQFLLAPRAVYRRAARRHWSALRSSTDRLVVITLSCGLEIFNTCVAGEAGQGGVSLIALGPVAWRAPAVPHTLIQGKCDYLSRAFFRKAHVVLPGVGHMNYLTHRETAHLTNAILCGNTLKS